MNINEIVKSTLLVDIKRVRANIKRMAEKANRNSVTFRPHFKTHQSAEIAEMFRGFGVDKITVTSVEMAEYFAKNGWTDITIAMPINIREIKKINELASKISLNLLVDSEFSMKFLIDKLKYDVDIWIEINAGYNRSGVLHDRYEEILQIAKIADCSDKTVLKGVLSHFGNTYSAIDFKSVQQIYLNSLNRMLIIKNKLELELGRKLLISIGDTPSCSILDDFGQIDEIRPGNFVFYDLMQLNIGSCAESDIAVVLACPIISKNNSRNEIVLYGGAIHLSKENIIYNGSKCFGAIVKICEKGWTKIIDNVYVKSVSQEHAIVHSTESLMNSVEIGDILGIIPVHSCLTANLMGKYLTTDGRIIEMAKLR